MKKLIVCCLLLVLAACGWVDSYHRARQLRTYTDLQQLAAQLEEVRARGRLTVATGTQIVNSLQGGRDAWGGRLLFHLRPAGAENVPSYSYVLVSPGRDGELDYDDPDEYFRLGESSVAWQFDRDIVFRDGTAVRSAGK